MAARTKVRAAAASGKWAWPKCIACKQVECVCPQRAVRLVERAALEDWEEPMTGRELALALRAQFEAERGPIKWKVAL